MTEPTASPWVRPGWHLAICEQCRPLAPTSTRDVQKRDAWAVAHTAGTGHTVCRFDGQPGRPVVTVDPAKKAGRPHIRGLTTEGIAGMVRAGEPLAIVADEYDLTRHEVVLACWYEGTHGAYRDVWRGWADAVAPGLGGHEPIDFDAVHEPPQRGGTDG